MRVLLPSSTDPHVRNRRSSLLLVLLEVGVDVGGDEVGLVWLIGLAS